MSGGIRVMNVKKIISALVMGSFIIALSGCTMIEKTPEAIKNTVLAKVGKVNITKGQLDDNMKTQYGDDYVKKATDSDTLKQEYTTVLNNMVEQEIFYQQAQKLNLVPDKNKLEDEIKKEIDSIKKNNFDNDEKKFEDAIKAQGMTMDSLKDQLKEQITMNPKQVAENRVVQYISQGLTVTDKEVTDYYNNNKASFTTQPGANFSHILVKTEQEAKDIKAQLDKGADFAELAKKYSTDTATKDAGGALGQYYTYDNTTLDKDFMAGAAKLNNNEVSGPIKTQFGYHIIKATGVNKQAVEQKFDDVKDQIKSQLLQSKQNDKVTKQLTQWKKDLNVKTYESRL
jgi:Parvulin-like peptidyl-prolyl isomerase